MSRTRRRGLTGPKRISKGCRNRGPCPYCAAGRRHAEKRRAPADADLQVAESLKATRNQLANAFGVSRDVAEVLLLEEIEKIVESDLGLLPVAASAALLCRRDQVRPPSTRRVRAAAVDRGDE